MKKYRVLSVLLAVLIFTVAVTVTASAGSPQAGVQVDVITVQPEIYQTTPEILASDTPTLLEHFLHTKIMRRLVMCSSEASYKRSIGWDIASHMEFQELLTRADLMDALDAYAQRIEQSKLTDWLDTEPFYILISHDSVELLISSTEISDSYPTLSAVYTCVNEYNASFLPDASDNEFC